MRAIQRAIVGVGLALVAVVAMALLIGDPRSAGPDPSGQPAEATGPRVPLVDVPAGPPEPVDAAEDTSVGTLPPPADASLSAKQVSRDLLAPAPDTHSPNARTPSDGKALGARKARTAKKDGETSGHVPATPEQDFTATQDGWEWAEWDGAESRYDDGQRDSDDCRRDRRHDRHDDCDDDRSDDHDDDRARHDWRD